MKLNLKNKNIGGIFLRCTTLMMRWLIKRCFYYDFSPLHYKKSSRLENYLVTKIKGFIGLYLLVCQAKNNIENTLSWLYITWAYINTNKWRSPNFKVFQNFYFIIFIKNLSLISWFASKNFIFKFRTLNLKTWTHNSCVFVRNGLICNKWSLYRMVYVRSEYCVFSSPESSSELFWSPVVRRLSVRPSFLPSVCL